MSQAACEMPIEAVIDRFEQEIQAGRKSVILSPVSARSLLDELRRLQKENEVLRARTG